MTKKVVPGIISGHGMDSKRISASTAPDQADGAMELPKCGDFDIRIGRDGAWYYKGSRIARKALVKLFSTVLRREADGTFWLVTPVERCRVEVEDAPFVAVELSVTGQGREQALRFRTNVEDWVEAGPDRPIRVEHDPESGEPRPYVLVRDGLEALILRSVYYDLVKYGVEAKVEGQDVLGVWSGKTFFALGTIA